MTRQQRARLDREVEIKRMVEEINRIWPDMNKPPTRVEKFFLWFLFLGLLAGLVALLISRFTGAF